MHSVPRIVCKVVHDEERDNEGESKAWTCEEHQAVVEVFGAEGVVGDDKVCDPRVFVDADELEHCACDAEDDDAQSAALESARCESEAEAVDEGLVGDDIAVGKISFVVDANELEPCACDTEGEEHSAPLEHNIAVTQLRSFRSCKGTMKGVDPAGHQRTMAGR